MPPLVCLVLACRPGVLYTPAGGAVAAPASLQQQVKVVQLVGVPKHTSVYDVNMTFAYIIMMPMQFFCRFLSSMCYLKLSSVSEP